MTIGKAPSLEQRISRLERSNWILVVALVGTLVLGLVGAPDEGEALRAGAFHLTDPDGKVRAELSLKDGAVGLFLKDEAGNNRLLATHDAEGTRLFLSDEAGQPRVGVAQWAHGGGGVALHGPEGKGAAVLYLKSEGSLRFFDAAGKVINQFPAPTAEYAE